MMILGLALIGGTIAYALGWRPQFLTKLVEGSKTLSETRDARYPSEETTPEA